MELYKNYIKMWRQGTVCAGFSPRLPDYTVRYWLDNLAKALPQHIHKASFLDVGAGDGRLSLLLLQAYSKKGMAIEVAANQKSWQSITDRFRDFEFKEGLLQDVFPVLLDTKKFDFILLAEVFEHIPLHDVAQFLQRVHMIMSDDGRIFLTTPNRSVQGPAEQSAMWHERQPYGHHKHYTLEELAEILDKAGFVIEWNVFECHKLKSRLYAKIFYPLSRWDARLMHSQKIPKSVRTAYYWLSMPCVLLARAAFCGISQALYSIEKNMSNERNSATIIMCIKKKAFPAQST